MTPLKAHWECWSDCNLHCGFCFRTRSQPLKTDCAKAMISSLSDCGFRDIAFAGGDPSLRSDISSLIEFAHSECSLNVEVQTNAHVFERVFLSSFDHIKLFGFSLDGPSGEVHDTIRSTKGNFDRVLSAIELCDEMQKSYVVRTVVTKENIDLIFDMLPLLSGRKFLKKWSLLEFSPIGDGFANRDQYELNNRKYLEVSSIIKNSTKFPVDVFENKNKGGIYFLIKTNGDVYTTEDNFEGEEYSSIGNVKKDGVNFCLEKLNITQNRHNERYESLI